MESVAEERPSSLDLGPDSVRVSKPLVAPRVLTGPASQFNQGAIDWYVCTLCMYILYVKCCFHFESMLISK